MSKYRFVKEVFQTTIKAKNGSEVKISFPREEVVNYLKEHGKSGMMSDDDGILLQNFVKLFTHDYNKANPPEPKGKATLGGKREGAGRKPKGGVGTKTTGMNIRMDIYLYVTNFTNYKLSDYFEQAVLEKIERDGGKPALERIAAEIKEQLKGDGE